MKRKYVFLVVILFTLLASIPVIMYIVSPRYKKYQITTEKWNDIIEKRIANNQLIIEELEFNDLKLMIDENNNTIYYSYNGSYNQFNPVMKYKANDNVKIAFSGDMEKNQDAEGTNVLVYDDNNYHIYKLILLNSPIISIYYKEYSPNTDKVDVTIIDNRKEATQKVIKSKATLLKMIDDNYVLSFRKDSVGHNGRKNDISIFGGEKEHEYLLIRNDTDEMDSKEEFAFFINKQYQGMYLLKSNEGRKEYE